MIDRRTIKSLVLFFLLLGTACGPAALPPESTPTDSATQAPPTASQAATAALPTGTSTPLPVTPTPIFEVWVDNLAAGLQGQIFATGFGAYGNDERHYAQWQGTRWIGLGGGFRTSGNALAVDSAGRAYTESLTESAKGQVTDMLRWDGAAWQVITGNFVQAVDALQAGRISSNIPVAGLAVDGKDQVYAAGSFFYPSADHTQEPPVGYVVKWDQATWTALGQGLDQVYLLALAVSPSGKVYVSGEQPRTPAGQSGAAGFLAEWDGETWRQIDMGQLSACWSIRRLALDPNGGLYASCSWGEPGELVFHWDGTDWTMITDRLEGEAPAIFGMAVDPDGRLYIGGSFDSVSGVPARNVASWDGSTWQALGPGIERQVNALTIAQGGDLCVAGPNTEAGGVPVPYVACWDGETWSAPGP